MNDLPSHLLFLGRVRRRWIAWRVVEFAAISAACGTAVGFIVLLVLLWRAEPAVQTAFILMGIGAAAGILLGMTRRPTLLQTAMMADRQLRLHDLLSTVMNPQAWIDEGFHNVILAQADRVCRETSPNELVVRRLSGRAWGGIGIASALLLTIAMMSGSPSLTEARMDSVRPDSVPNAQVPIHVVAEDRSTAVAQISGRRSGAEVGQDASARADGSTDSQDRSNDEASGRMSRAAPSNSSNSTSDAAGAAPGRSNDGQMSQLKLGSSAPAGGNHAPIGEPSTGGVNGNVSPELGSSAGAGKIAGPDSTAKLEPPAPWTTSSWPAARDAARLDVENGKIPDFYLGLVKEYFDLAAQ